MTRFELFYFYRYLVAGVIDNRNIAQSASGGAPETYCTGNRMPRHKGGFV